MPKVLFITSNSANQLLFICVQTGPGTETMPS